MMFVKMSQKIEVLEDLGEGTCERCYRFRNVYVTECWIPGVVSDVRCICLRCSEQMLVYGEAA